MTADSTQVFPPMPRYTVLPPPPVPQYLLGRTLVIRFRISENGKPDLAATVIRGPIRSPYLERFSAALRGWEFDPGVLNGCAVPASFVVTITM